MAFKAPKMFRIKPFLLFVGLATFFWLLTKFSKAQRDSFPLELVFYNIPEQVYVKPQNPTKLYVNARLTGFQRLVYEFQSKFLRIDLSAYPYNSEFQIALSALELESLIRLQHEKAFTDFNVNTSLLQISLGKINAKKVAVKVPLEISYKDGFQSVGKPEVQPDSVWVQGPKDVLDTLQVIYTDAVVEANVSKSFLKELPLKVPATLKLNKAKQITFSQIVEEFVPFNILVPVHAINVNESQRVQIIPSKITVAGYLPLSYFNEVVDSSFYVVCDVSKIVENPSHLIPELIKKPVFFKDAVLQPMQLEYLIFK